MYDFRLVFFKDIDEYFQKQREWAVEYGKYMKEASQVLSHFVNIFLAIT